MKDKKKVGNYFQNIYDKFKLMFYRGIFAEVKEREGSLSAMEAFSLEVIDMLDKPTISRFAEFLNISQSNATYKVNSLIKKGYIERENSMRDHREYHLILSEKYRNFIKIAGSYEKKVLDRICDRFSEEDIEKFTEMLGIISSELMSECSDIK